MNKILESDKKLIKEMMLDSKNQSSLYAAGNYWSGSRESNPLPNRWQRFALPMS